MNSTKLPSPEGSGSDDVSNSGSSQFILPSIFSLLHVVWLRKWAVLVVWLVISLPVGILLSVFDLPRSYTATTVMRFPAVVGAQTNVMRDIAITQGESIISIFNSFQVVKATIDKLSLRLNILTPEAFRRDIFQSTQYSEDLGLGVYTLTLQNSGKAILSYLPRDGQEEYPLFQGPIKDGVIKVPGLVLEFKPEYLKRQNSSRIEMEFITLEEGIQAVNKSFSVRPIGASNFHVSLKNRDPYLVAEILNELREEFLQIYYGTTEVQNVGVLAQMEKDLELAKSRLEKSQDEVSKFYGEHPELVVDQRANTAGDNLAYLNARQEADLTQARKSRVQAAYRAKPDAGKTKEYYYWAGEVLGAMAEAGDPKASILRSRLLEIESQQDALSSQLGLGHPRLLEIDEQKKTLYSDMEKAEADLIRTIDQKLSDLRVALARSAPTVAPTIPVKVRLELDRLTSVNNNNEQTYNSVLESYNRAKLVTGSEFFKVTVVDVARPAIYFPPMLQSRLIVAGAVIALLFFVVPVLFAGFSLVFPRVYTKDDILKLLKVKVLGSISQGTSPESGKPKKFFGRNTPSPAPSTPGEVESLLLFFGKSYKLGDLESYRLIREEAESFYRNPSNPQSLVLLVTSTQPGEGKTLTCSNLALTFARKGKRTLLIDADFRLGRVAQVFNATPSTGLDEMLSQEDLSMNEFLGAASLCFVPSLQNGLVLVPRKVNNPNAGEMVSSDRFKAFVHMAKEQFDVVIIDTPPMMITPEPLSLAEIVDGVLFVTRSGITPVSAAREALQVLRDRHVRVATVLNGVRHSPFEDDRYQKYSAYYREGALRPPTGSRTPEVNKVKATKAKPKPKPRDSGEASESASA